MIIIGAGGFAKEVYETLDENERRDVIFFDEFLDLNSKAIFLGKHTIISSLKDAQKIFIEHDPKFILGLGKPKIRSLMYQRFQEIGGRVHTTVSNDSFLSTYVKIGEGTNILSGAKISNNVSIGRCCIVYYNVVITHDVVIGDFCELSPGCIILGNSKINKNVHIGAGAIILPNIEIGENSIVGAGSVVTKSIQANSIVKGIPAKP